MKRSILKKCSSLFMTLFLFASMVTPVYAKDNSINVQLNGENITFDVAPRMVNSRVMVPMRTIFEQLGVKVDWNSQTGAITATKDQTVIKLNKNSRAATVTKNGVPRQLQLDASPVVVNGRTLVPVRFISESLGKQVGWDAENKTVIIIDYNYFFDEFKTQAPNFYNYVTNQYEVIKTGEIKSSADISFKYDPESFGEKVNGNIKATINTKLNEDNGSADANIKITGLDEFLAMADMKEISDTSLKVLFDNNSFYVKSNLFSLLEKQGISVGDKWIKADFADLGNPDIKTLQDLKDLQTNQLSLSKEQMLDLIANTPADLNVNSFREVQTVFETLVTLVDNDHFKLVDNGDTKVYTWNINKQDLVDVVLDLEKKLGSVEDMTSEDLAEIKEFLDNLAFDFNMQVGVKNNIIVSSKTALTAKMDIPETGYFELSLQSGYEVLNPNNGEYDITMPNPGNVIDFQELEPENLQKVTY